MSLSIRFCRIVQGKVTSRLKFSNLLMNRCERVISTPNNSLLYCSEQCRKLDASPKMNTSNHHQQPSNTSSIYSTSAPSSFLSSSAHLFKSSPSPTLPPDDISGRPLATPAIMDLNRRQISSSESPPPSTGVGRSNSEIPRSNSGALLSSSPEPSSKPALLLRRKSSANRPLPPLHHPDHLSSSPRSLDLVLPLSPLPLTTLRSVNNSGTPPSTRKSLEFKRMPSSSSLDHVDGEAPKNAGVLKKLFYFRELQMSPRT